MHKAAAQQAFAPDNLPLGFSKALRQPKYLWLGVVSLARLRVKLGVGRKKIMTNWTKLDEQMRAFSPFLRDEFKIGPPESNALASALARDINALPRDALQSLLADGTVLP
ncbi:MAG TPA: hypothetical protein ENN79_14290, partial [Desulfobacteraceae bacterium]|nr:hypothetical protein [Desulfobacteraceae bacterium]